MDWVELTYNSEFVTDSDSLCFDYTAGTHQFQVGNFTSDLLSVYDVTDPEAVRYLTGILISESDSYNRVNFQTTSMNENKICVIEETALRAVKSIEMDIRSNLSSPTNSANCIVITPKIFNSQAETLSNHRASQGLRTVVVHLQDIYDEFGFGLEDVEHIRPFYHMLIIIGSPQLRLS